MVGERLRFEGARASVGVSGATAYFRFKVSSGGQPLNTTYRLVELRVRCTNDNAGAVTTFQPVVTRDSSSGTPAAGMSVVYFASGTTAASAVFVLALAGNTYEGRCDDDGYLYLWVNPNAGGGAFAIDATFEPLETTAFTVV
jgi:hypothetical protein